MCKKQLCEPVVRSESTVIETKEADNRFTSAPDGICPQILLDSFLTTTVWSVQAHENISPAILFCLQEAHFSP